MNEAMDLKKHLEVYKEARTQWAGREEENPNVAVLDQVIAQIEQRIQAQGSGGAPQVNPAATEAQLGGQVRAGAMGGVQ
jgi:hypothetical protein